MVKLNQRTIRSTILIGIVDTSSWSFFKPEEYPILVYYLPLFHCLFLLVGIISCSPNSLKKMINIAL